MRDSDTVTQEEALPPLKLWEKILGFFFLVPCGAGTAFIVLGSLSAGRLIPPRESMWEPVFNALLGLMLVYGPFWRVFRRDWPLVAGFIVGVIVLSVTWWRSVVA